MPDSCGEEEIRTLRDQCMAIIAEFERREQSAVWSEWRSVVAKSATEQNVRGLRLLNRDLVEWAKSVGVVVAETTPDVNNSGSFDSSRLEAAVSRGRIDDPEEYASCLKRVEEIYDDLARSEELQTINGLLQKYHLHHRGE